MPSKLIGYFFHIGGSILSKSLPIIFGIVLSKFYGSNAYVNFVDLLIVGNLIVSISSGGFIPQLMVSTKYKYNRERYFVLSYLIILIFLLINIIHGKINSSNQLFLLLYVFGYNTVLLSVASLNGVKKNIDVGKLWVFTFLFESILVGSLLYYGDSSKTITVIYGLGYFLVGLISLFYIFKKELIYLSFDFLNKEEVKEILLNGVLITSFASTTLLGFKILINKISLPNHIEIYSLGYQLFSVMVFLPLILGGLVIPYLSEKNNSDSANKSSLKVFLIYLIIGVFQLSICYYFIPTVLKFYDLPLGVYNVNTLFVFSIGALIATLNTFFVYYFNSFKKYKTLLVAGVLWLTPILFVFTRKTIDAKQAAWCIVISYLLSMIYLIFEKKYAWTEKK